MSRLPFGLLLLGLFATAGASERVDFFDVQGRRAGYAVVDAQSGRVDVYDVQSRRTGWGRIDPATGRIELFDLEGRRRPLDPGQHERR